MSFRPLANLVDAAALKWLAAETASLPEQMRVRMEITADFRIGEEAELTFHGLKYQLTISRPANVPAGEWPYRIEAREIVEE